MQHIYRTQPESDRVAYLPDRRSVAAACRIEGLLGRQTDEYAPIVLFTKYWRADRFLDSVIPRVIISDPRSRQHIEVPPIGPREDRNANHHKKHNQNPAH